MSLSVRPNSPAIPAECGGARRPALPSYRHFLHLSTDELRELGRMGGIASRERFAQQPTRTVVFVTGPHKGKRGVLLAKKGSSVDVRLDDGEVIHPRTTSVIEFNPFDSTAGLAAHARMPQGRQYGIELTQAERDEIRDIQRRMTNVQRQTIARREAAQRLGLSVYAVKRMGGIRKARAAMGVV